MPEDFLKLFVPQKQKQGPPAPAAHPLDAAYKALGVKGGAEEVGRATSKRRAANDAKTAKVRKGVAEALSPDDARLAKSIVFMSSVDSDGAEMSFDTPVDRLSEYRPTIGIEDAVKMVKDPAQRKVWEESRKVWRERRQKVPQADTGPSLRPLTKAEHERSMAEQEAARVPLGPVGTFQKQAEDAAGALFRHLPVPGGENIAKGVVGAALSPFSSGEMMNDARVPDYDRNMAAAQFFAGLLAATGGGSFVSNFTKSGGSLAKGVMGSVGALKEAVPELAGKIDEAASVLSKLPEQEADDLLRSVTPENPVTAQAEAPVTGPKEPWQMTKAGALAHIRKALDDAEAFAKTHEPPKEQWTSELGDSLKKAQTRYDKVRRVWEKSSMPDERLSKELKDAEASLVDIRQRASVAKSDNRANEDFWKQKERDYLLKEYPDLFESRDQWPFVMGSSKYSEFSLSHKDAVKKALSEGKPVPPEVLADYPDLAAKYATSEAPTSEFPNSPRLDPPVIAGVRINDANGNPKTADQMSAAELDAVADRLREQAVRQENLKPGEVALVTPESSRARAAEIDAYREQEFGPRLTKAQEAPTSAKAVSEPSTIASEARTQEAPPTTLEAPQEPEAISEGQSLSTPPQSTRRTVADIDAELKSVIEGRRARIEEAASGGKMNASSVFDPTDLEDAYKIGRLLFERGLRTFQDWAKEMVSHFGKAVKPHLDELWKKAGSEPDGGSVSRVQAALKKAKPLRSDYASTLMEEARAERAARLADAQESSVGKPFQESVAAQMATQKGSYSNFSFELPEAIGPDDLAHLKDMVLTHPGLKPYEKQNTTLALEKIAGDGRFGGLPTDGELALLGRVFGPEFVTTLKSKAAPDIVGTLWQEFILHRKAFLLFNPRTVLRNFIGNAAQAVRREGLKPADVLTDQLVRISFPKATEGRRTMALGAPSLEDSASALSDTWRDMKDTMAHGMKWEGSAEVTKESVDPLAKYALRFQGVQDAPWMNSAYRRSLIEQASLMVKADKTLDFRTLVDAPTEAMQAQAMIDAQVSTFNSPNKLTEGLKSLSKIPVVGPLMDFIVPFKKVPSNIGSELAQANPVGALVNWGLAYNEVRTTGKMSYATQKHLSRATTNGALGTGLLWLGFDLARRGLLTGAPPPDQGQRTANEALNVRPMSLEANGARYQLSGTHPFLSVVAVGASMFESGKRRFEKEQAEYERLQKKGADPASFGVKVTSPSPDVRDVGSWAVAAAAIMQEQPFLKGIKDLTDAAQNENSFSRILKNWAGSLVGTATNDAMRTFGKGDDTLRETDDGAQMMRARMGFGQDLAPKYDAFGRAVKLGGVYDVTNAKEVRTDPVSLLMKANGLKVTKLEKVNGESAKHYAVRQALYGRILYKAAEAFARSVAENKVSDKKAVQGAWDDMVSKVRSATGSGLNIDALRGAWPNADVKDDAELTRLIGETLKAHGTKR